MGILFRDREEDLADPDLRASRYFLFKNKQTEKNKLKNAEKKYGYTLGELHAYKHLMKPPQMPERMQHERPEMKYTYDQIHKLVGIEKYEQQTENHFAVKPEEKSWSRKKPLDEQNCFGGAQDDRLKANLFTSEHANDVNASSAIDESCVKCLGYYLALDRCVRAVSKEDEKNRIYKYTRLHACKPHWVNPATVRGTKAHIKVESQASILPLRLLADQIWFKRCTNYRDEQFLKEISSWEGEYFQSLGAPEKMQREASHLAARIEKLREGGSAA